MILKGRLWSRGSHQASPLQPGEADPRRTAGAQSLALQQRVHRVRVVIAKLSGLACVFAIFWDRAHEYTLALAEEGAQPAQPAQPVEGVEGERSKDPKSEAPTPAPPTTPAEAPAAPSVAEPAPSRPERFDMSLGVPRQPIEPKALGDKEIKPLGDVDRDSFEVIRTKGEACRRFEGKLIAFYDQTALIQKCKMRLIEDPLLLNAVRKQNEGKIQDVPASVYRLFPMGEPIREGDIKGIERMLGFAEVGLRCDDLNGDYVTANGTDFYFVENCKKRRFKSYAGLEEHNRSKRTVRALAPSQLAELKDGKEMPNEGLDVADVWFQIDGDAGWHRGAATGDQKPMLPDSPERLREVARQQRDPVKARALCGEVQGKVVSFYHQLYFVDQCQLRVIDEKDQLQLQVRLEGREKVRDLSAAEKRALRDGRPMSVADVLRRLGR